MHVQNRPKAAQIKTKYVNWYQGYCPRNRVCSLSPDQKRLSDKRREMKCTGEKITDK